MESHATNDWNVVVTLMPQGFRDAVREHAKRAVAKRAADLAGKRFLVRMHRRGFKGLLISQAEERALGEYLLERTHEQGATAHVAFDDPDWVIAVETVDSRAGLSRWRSDLQRYELLRLD